MPTLPPGEVHVWRAVVDLADEGAARREADALSVQERARAEQFRRREDRVRFVAARARLREMVGGYLGIVPREVVFEAGPHGKPGVVGAPELSVSVARSGEVVLMGAAIGADIGVDVERIDACFPWSEVAELAFDAPELEALARIVDPAARAEAHFEAWVRKEAYAKMTGLGIAHLLDGDHRPPDVGHVFIEMLRPAEGYCGALAVGSHRLSDAPPSLPRRIFGTDDRAHPLGLSVRCWDA